MMSKRHQYYTLIASLPKLVRFDEAERLPINMERLKERMTMLSPEDQALVDRVSSFIVWRRQPLERSDGEMVADYRKLIKYMDDPILDEMIELRVDVRTIIVALRRRRQRKPAPKAGEFWGVGRFVRHIEQNWDDPNFRLASVYPWIPQAREYMETGQALALERLLMNVIWNGVDRLKEDMFFGFDVVVAYLFKWDITQRWLAYNVDGAKVRFDELTAEALHEQENLFG